jgi:hypothetical protein
MDKAEGTANIGGSPNAARLHVRAWTASRYCKAES